MVFSPSAVEDLQAIAAYYDEQDVPDIGRQTIIKLLNAAKELAEFPQMGRVVPEFNTANIRELIRSPFRIVYRLEQNQAVSVIRIWRSERVLELPKA